MTERTFPYQTLKLFRYKIPEGRFSVYVVSQDVHNGGSIEYSQ